MRERRCILCRECVSSRGEIGDGLLMTHKTKGDEVKEESGGYVRVEVC